MHYQKGILDQKEERNRGERDKRYLVVLGCKRIHFVVINADDYYGKEAFVKVHDFLDTLKERKTIWILYGWISFGNTLSEHGTVTRGVCRVSEDGVLLDIEETSDIEKKRAGCHC